MKILKIKSRNRRDFWAEYQCEACGYVDKYGTGYDDAYFHNEVIPAMECPECGVASNTVTSSATIPADVVM